MVSRTYNCLSDPQMSDDKCMHRLRRSAKLVNPIWGKTALHALWVKSGWLAEPAPRTDVIDWVTSQVKGLVAYCATTNESPAEKGSYSVFLRKLETLQKYRELPEFANSIISELRWRCGKFSNSKPTLAALLAASAMQSVKIEEILERPQETASLPVVDIWSTFTARTLAVQDFKWKVNVASWAIGAMLNAEILPPMGFVLRLCRVLRRDLREADPERYEMYERKFQAQGTYTERLHIHRRLKLVYRMTIIAHAWNDNVSSASLIALVAAKLRITTTEAEEFIVSAASMRCVAKEIVSRLSRPRFGAY